MIRSATAPIPAIRAAASPRSEAQDLPILCGGAMYRTSDRANREGSRAPMARGPGTHLATPNYKPISPAHNRPDPRPPPRWQARRPPWTQYWRHSRAHPRTHPGHTPGRARQEYAPGTRPSAHWGAGWNPATAGEGRIPREPGTDQNQGRIKRRRAYRRAGGARPRCPGWDRSVRPGASRRWRSARRR